MTTYGDANGWRQWTLNRLKMRQRNITLYRRKQAEKTITKRRACVTKLRQISLFITITQHLLVAWLTKWIR